MSAFSARQCMYSREVARLRAYSAARVISASPMPRRRACGNTESPSSASSAPNARWAAPWSSSASP